MSVPSEQLFTEVEVNRPGYSPSRECGEVNILGFSPTLSWIITLAYTNQRISEEKITIFVFLCRILKFVNKRGRWQLFRVRVTSFASLVKLRRKTKFKNKTLPWKRSKLNFVAFFVLIGIAFSFISGFELRSNLPEARTPCWQFRVQSCEPGIS